ncbi:gliding motility-associated C-terminal domain-containing protein [Flavobacteriaceae bacterium]|nr:gliding motility-associated C-terminal domain-containing protein [Flavobacteriaceae bacterium]
MKYNYSFFVLIPIFSLAQFNLYSDFYIAPDTELHITAPITTFTSGNFLTDHGPDGGVVSFASNSSWEAADHNAHIDGNVKVYNPTTFALPTGHKAVFQPLAIREASGVSFINIDYRHQSHSNLTPSSGILKIHPAHYWNINQATGSAKVELTWNAFSNLDTFLEGLSLDDLSIVGYANNAWVLLPSSLSNAQANNLSFGAIVSNASINLSSYDALALSVKGIAGPDGEPTDMPLVAEGISPNGDRDNDTWMIQGIENFPKARVTVYNTLGDDVFTAFNGYNNDWRGDFNNSGDPLPSGPYFYTIDLDADGDIDQQGWLYIQN